MSIKLVLPSLVLAAGVSVLAICAIGFAVGNLSMDTGLTKGYVVAGVNLTLVGFYWLLAIWDGWPTTDPR